MNVRSTIVMLTGLLLTVAGVSAAERVDDQKALAPWQSYVGAWRGVGQPERGSQKGAWTEKSSWAWKFDKAGAAIEFASPESKQFVAGRIEPGEQPETFRLIAKDASGVEHAFTGRRDEKDNWVFTADDAEKSPVARITLRQVADGARLIVLLERQVSPTRLARVAEIGYTREGAAFATGATGPECIVTGGDGTIPVTYQGQTYYVCCTGCKDYFESDPARAIAEYKARKAEQNSK